MITQPEDLIFRLQNSYDSLLLMRTGMAQNLGSRITTKARVQHEIARKIQRIAPDVRD